MEGKRCFADFWHNPDSPPEDCHLGQTYESSTGSEISGRLKEIVVKIHLYSFLLWDDETISSSCLCANDRAGVMTWLAYLSLKTGMGKQLAWLCWRDSPQIQILLLSHFCFLWITQMTYSMLYTFYRFFFVIFLLFLLPVSNQFQFFFQMSIPSIPSAVFSTQIWGLYWSYFLKQKISTTALLHLRCLLMCFSYRKVISNMCEGGLNKQQSAKQHNCPLLPPQGLRVGIKGQMLAVAPGDDITFIVHQEQVGWRLFSCPFNPPSFHSVWIWKFLSVPNRATLVAPSIRWTSVTEFGLSTRTWQWQMSPSSIATKFQACTRSQWRLRTWQGTMRPPCTSRSQVSITDRHWIFLLGYYTVTFSLLWNVEHFVSGSSDILSTLSKSAKITRCESRLMSWWTKTSEI